MPKEQPEKGPDNQDLRDTETAIPYQESEDNRESQNEIVAGGKSEQDVDTLEALDLFEYFRILDLESGDFVSESPLATRQVSATLTLHEQDQVFQWKQLQALQLRLAYLRIQFYHRKSIHKYDRPQLYATLRLANLGKVFDELKHVPKNEWSRFRSTLRAIARWRETVQWAEEAIEVVKGCRLIEGNAKNNFLVTLQMVVTASRANGRPEVPLANESLDVDQRRRIPIQVIQRSLRYLDQSCRVRLLEAEASLVVLMSSFLGSLPPPSGISEAELTSFQNTIRKQNELEEELLKKARAIYVCEARSTLKNAEIEKRLRVGSDKAQAIKNKMRSEGLETTRGRNKRSNRPSAP